MANPQPGQPTEAEIKAAQREALAPSDKVRALQLGRKLKDFLLNEIGDQETHFKIIKGALIYVMIDIQEMDQHLREHYLVNDYKTMIKKVDEEGIREKIYEWGSEEEKAMLENKVTEELKEAGNQKEPNS